jgi:hypothetical protein
MRQAYNARSIKRGRIKERRTTGIIECAIFPALVVGRALGEIKA